MPPFFVVARRKLLLMMVMTAGLYWHYCLYRSWHEQGARHGVPVRPILRAVLYWPFIHAFLREIEKTSTSGSSPCHRGARVLFAIGLSLQPVLVGVVVCLAIFPLKGWVAAVVLALLIQLWLASSVQQAINRCSADLGALRNAGISADNWFWMLMGGVLWGILLLLDFGPIILVECRLY